MNINRSNEVIENLRNTEGRDVAYPMAFGYAWGLLSDEARDELLKWAEKKVSQKG